MVNVQLILHNIRSAHNIGSIFRTAEGFNVEKIILSGYTPYPLAKNDTRLPHISEKLTKQISKVSLGAEELVRFEYQEQPDISQLKRDGYTIIGLEQDARSVSITSYAPPDKIAIIIGEEVNGIAQELRDECEELIEIPMYGKKESFNVSVAVGICLYALTSER